MYGIIICLGGVAILLLGSEFLWRTRLFKDAETSRKLVHIAVGVFIAFWPLFISFNWIKILSLAMFIGVFASKKMHIFRSIHSVRRITYGELFFPLGVLVSAVLTNSGWIYMAAVLHLSLADGLAALVGVHFTRTYGYKVFGQTKTVIGTITFYLTSVFIIAATMRFDPAAYSTSTPYVVLILPIATTVIENIGVYGTDNILVPIVVIAILGGMRIT